MTTRSDVNRLVAVNRRLVEMAKADLRKLVDSLDLSRPEMVRDLLMEVVPALVSEYGEVAAAAAAEWYEETRALQESGAYLATVGGRVPDDAVLGSVRWAAGDLFTDDAMAAFSKIEGAMQRHISYSSRETVRRNVEADPTKPRFGRVPSGPSTCAFCGMLASRGFVYATEATAGDMGRGVGDDFHDDCDCQVVPEWDAEAHHIEGYDPDALYDVYLKAREQAGSGDLKNIAAEMRRLEPDLFTDGVHKH